MPVITTNLKWIIAKSNYRKNLVLRNALILDVHFSPPFYQNDAPFFLLLYNSTFSHSLISLTHHQTSFHCPFSTGMLF